MKKIIIYVLILLLVIISMHYNTIIKVGDLIKPYSAENLPDEMKTSIFIAVHLNKELNVDKAESKKEIIDFLSSMKVKKVLINPESYSIKSKETYHIFLYSYEKEMKTVYIYILDKKHIMINDTTYKIVGNPRLSLIYDSIIRAQPKGSLEKLYYDLIED